MFRNFCLILSLLFSASALAPALAPALAHEAVTGGLLFNHPWIRATAPNAPMAAGYLKITNIGIKADRIIGAEADFADSVEIHEVIKDGDISRMRALPHGLAIAPDTEIIFQPSGYHLMFRGIDKQMVVGDKHTIWVSFETAGKVMLEFLVERAGKRTHDYSQNMKMGTMSGDNH